MLKLTGKIALYVAAFAAISGAVNIGTDWWATKQSTLDFADAARISNQRLLSTAGDTIDRIPAGGVFRIAFDIERNQACEAIIQNSLVVVQADNSITQMFNFNHAPFRYVPKGRYSTQEILQIPEWLPPGRYNFMRQVRYLCEGKRPAYFTFANLPLEVTK